MVMLVYGIYGLALAPFEPLKKLGTIIFQLDRGDFSGCLAWRSYRAAHAQSIADGQFHCANAANRQCADSLPALIRVHRPSSAGALLWQPGFRRQPGLGVLATTQLVQAAWLPTSSAFQLYSIIYFYSGLGACAGLLIWAAYFALPEAERRMVLLPTTSPYFFWNKISEALGDAPGFVAISGFTPESMAPGELAAMIEASQPPVIEVRPKVMQPIAIAR